MSWPTVPLSDVVECLDNLRKPVTANMRAAGEVPYYGANGPQGWIDRPLFDEPLILVAEDGGHFTDRSRGVAYYIEGPAWVNNHAHVLRSTNINSRYLYRILENYDFLPFISGSTRLKLTKGQLLRVPIPLPPIEEQRRIAAILDQADAIRTKRNQIVLNMEEIAKSLFLDAFGDPLDKVRGRKKVPLGSVAKIKTGNSPSRSDTKNFGEFIEWIKSDNLGGLVATKATEGLSELGSLRARKVPSGSLLVTCIAGSPESIGKCSLVDRPVSFNQQINAVLPSESLLNDFLMHQLKIRPEIVRQASSGGMKGLVSKEAFSRIEILLPTLEDQKEFVQKIKQLRNNQEKVKISSNFDDELFASLQTRAFRGEL